MKTNEQASPMLTREELIKRARKIDSEKVIKKTTLQKAAEEKIEQEKQRIEELNAMLNYKESEKIEEEEPIEEYDENGWDVPLGTPIEYFDPELSYELTGYRPITKTRGLDFDPKEFTKAADNFRMWHSYTKLTRGTFAHRAYWLEELHRCQKGYTIGKYTLTGYNYFWLNYYRLKSVLGEGDDEIVSYNFPGFLAKQYEYFHYIELCKKLGKDGLAFKSRGVGASEIAASNMACEFVCHKESTTIVTAFSDEYANDTFDKAVICLDWLNANTETGFYRARMKMDTQTEKRASIIDKDRNESGWMSTMKSVVADKPRKLRGKRVQTLYFEEAGSNPILLDTYVQSRPLVELNGRRVGSRFVFGTGGDTGAAIAGIKKMFYNPTNYAILPYKHTYAKDGQIAYTGYFIPAFSMWFGTSDPITGTLVRGFDSRGVVNEEAAKAYYQKTWESITDSSDRIKEQAEYCFSPEDAFVLEGANNFDQEKLLDQLHNIELHNIISRPQHLKLYWQLKDGVPDINVKPSFEIVGNSTIEFTELPITDENGHVYKDLYVIGIDGIDADDSTSSGQTDVSQFCCVVFRRQFGLRPPKPVAIYKHRPHNIKDAWETALKLALFYNAKVLVESTRVSVIQYFQRQKKDHFLMRRPQATANKSGKTNFKQIGTVAVQAVIQHQLDLISNYIDEYCEQICFPQMLNELITYSYENKRKFDIVAAFGIALLADEDMIGKTAKLTGSVKKLNLGFSKNAKGVTSFGIIQNQEEKKYDFFRRRD